MWVCNNCETSNQDDASICEVCDNKRHGATMPASKGGIGRAAVLTELKGFEEQKLSVFLKFLKNLLDPFRLFTSADEPP